ncbi:unnamed protein product, partial [Ectocarpus sp. 12 AP-2014]
SCRTVRRCSDSLGIFRGHPGRQAQSPLRSPLLNVRLGTERSNTQGTSQEASRGRFGRLPHTPILDRHCPLNTDWRPTKATFRLPLVSLLVELSSKGPPKCEAKSRVCPQDLRSAETLPFPANTPAENRGSMQAERGTRMIGCRHPRLVGADLPEVHDGLRTDTNQHSAWWFR